MIVLDTIDGTLVWKMPGGGVISWWFVNRSPALPFRLSRQGYWV